MKLDDYVQSLAAVSPLVAGADLETLELCGEAAEGLAHIETLSVETLAELVRARPDFVPVIAAAVGFSRERLKGWLHQEFDTAGWITLARNRPLELIQAMDEAVAVVEILERQRSRSWTWGEVLAASMGGRKRAGSAIEQGRALEDEVEALLTELGLDAVPRTRMTGVNGQTAPADFALPGGFADTRIAIAVKGFDSTGSKLGDAAREIVEMATVRTPGQYVFAVVDGMGWRRRRSDLARILEQAETQNIAGVFSRADFGSFRTELRKAAKVHDLLDGS